jgi:hypothetical protein
MQIWSPEVQEHQITQSSELQTERKGQKEMQKKDEKRQMDFTSGNGWA